MTTKTKPRVIEIAGRRWFSRTYGNTYFTCAILIDGYMVHQTDDYQYGYGDYYAQWATEWLTDNGHLPKFERGDSLSMYCREFDIVLIAHAADVSRRKDL